MYHLLCKILTQVLKQSINFDSWSPKLHSKPSPNALHNQYFLSASTGQTHKRTLALTTHTRPSPFPGSCQGREAEFGGRKEQRGRNTTCSLKEKLLAWLAQAEANGEILCVPCASAGGEAWSPKEEGGEKWDGNDGAASAKRGRRFFLGCLFPWLQLSFSLKCVQVSASRSEKCGFLL